VLGERVGGNFSFENICYGSFIRVELVQSSKCGMLNSGSSVKKMLHGDKSSY